MSAVAVKKIPMGVRSIPLPQRSDTCPKFVPESCGKGRKVGRLPHLDQLDGDTFK